MENIQEVEFIGLDGTKQISIIIDKGNGEFTSMPKAIWDEQQAKQTQGGLN